MAGFAYLRERESGVRMGGRAPNFAPFSTGQFRSSLSRCGSGREDLTSGELQDVHPGT